MARQSRQNARGALACERELRSREKAQKRSLRRHANRVTALRSGPERLMARAAVELPDHPRAG